MKKLFFAVYLLISCSSVFAQNLKPLDSPALIFRTEDATTNKIFLNALSLWNGTSSDGMDKQRAAELIDKAAQEGNVNAAMFLAKAYDEVGEKSKSADYLKIASKAGSLEASVILTNYLLGQKAYADMALYMDRVLELSNDSKILIQLGEMYLNPELKNHVQAIKAFQKASKNQDAVAYRFLALMVAEGLGTKKDPAKSVALLRKSAALGNADSMALLAGAYHKGVGVTKDLKLAYLWLAKAFHYDRSLQANVSAQMLASSLIKEMSPQLRAQADQEQDNFVKGKF